VGHGFGTEEAVFVDRFWGFQGGVPENSFLGLFLQLGAVGVVLFLVLIGALAAATLRVLRTERNLAAACLGVLGAGVVLSLVQSYLFAIGNVAMLTVWTCALLPAGRSRDRQG
jgi:O-antigen ligase